MSIRSDFERFDRTVAVLLPDLDAADAITLTAMFQAALMDFPRLGINPRRVTVAPAP